MSITRYVCIGVVAVITVLLALQTDIVTRVPVAPVGGDTGHSSTGDEGKPLPEPSTGHSGEGGNSSDTDGPELTLAPTTGTAARPSSQYRNEGDANPTLELEFAVGTKPLLLWTRHRNTESQGSAQRRKGHIRMACMYGGFLRNWEWMMAACRDMQTARFCNFPTCVKLFGNQRRHLLESTNCDVYMSTWQLRGAGRYDTFSYDQNKLIEPDRVFQYFGKWLYALHIQNYSHYAPLWEKMHVLARTFPQTKPTVVLGIGDAFNARWAGRAETRRFLRRNDYSQAYKHWCLLRLVQMSQRPYEAYYRLRADLRMTRLLTAPRRVTPKTAAVAPAGAEYVFRLINPNGTYSWHGFGEQLIHVNNYDVGDFGWMGTPAVISELSQRIWNYCLAEPDRSVKPLTRVSHHVIAEYNLMLWRIVFDEKWGVNSGMRYLWVSRSRKRCKQKKPKPGQKGFGKPLPPVVNFSVATWNVADDRE